MDVGKREDRLLDAISVLTHNRDNTKALLDFYLEGHLISPEVASHLWETLYAVPQAIEEEVVEVVK